MSDKSVLEALDRTLQDIMGNFLPFGGKVIFMSGDFRQILPVVKKGTRADIVKACLKKSYLWEHVRVRTLRTNMRAHVTGDPNALSRAQILLDIGDGKLTIIEQPDIVAIPPELGTVVSTLTELKNSIYGEANFSNSDWLAERGIISPFREAVQRLNCEVMAEFPGTSRDYFSADSVSEDLAVQFPTEVLNSIDLSGFPPHKLTLKVGAPIMVLRGLQPPKLINGTRCVITKLQNNIVEAKISCGPYKNEKVLIPRIPLKSSESSLNFPMKRLQFPIVPCFAMTINKSQGQTFKKMGVDLSTPCFAHGMFYVAASRTGSADGLTLLTPNATTRNVVYNEVFQ